MTHSSSGLSMSHTETHLTGPHRRLMVAVLKRAIDDVQASADLTPSGVRCLRKATAYVASGDRVWPFSFENLCEALGFDARLLRRALHRAEGEVEN